MILSLVVEACRISTNKSIVFPRTLPSFVLRHTILLLRPFVLVLFVLSALFICLFVFVVLVVDPLAGHTTTSKHNDVPSGRGIGALSACLYFCFVYALITVLPALIDYYYVSTLKYMIWCSYRGQCS